MTIHKKIIYLLTAIVLIQVNLINAQKTNPKSQSEELGAVQWYRNYDDAIAIAKKKIKLLLFCFKKSQAAPRVEIMGIMC